MNPKESNASGIPERQDALFDRSRLQLSSLSERIHDLDASVVMPLKYRHCPENRFAEVAARIIDARQNNAAVVLMMGAHVIRRGVQRYLIDLIANNDVTAIAVNGACTIHDWEFALLGATTESVSRYIRDGRFGFWKETGRINDIVKAAADDNLGIGEALGAAIIREALPYQNISLFAAACRKRIPITVHVGIGCDITHQHPNFDGAAYGAASYKDFLKLAREIENLEGGVLMVFGSSVMAPEIFLKALSMARNAARQNGKTISRFTTLVCDLRPLPDDIENEPDKGDPCYYFRPWKTLLVRTVQDGGQSYYVRGDHAETIPALWTAIKEAERSLLKTQSACVNTSKPQG